MNKIHTYDLEAFWYLQLKPHSNQDFHPNHLLPFLFFLAFLPWHNFSLFYNHRLNLPLGKECNSEWKHHDSSGIHTRAENKKKLHLLIINYVHVVLCWQANTSQGKHLLFVLWDWLIPLSTIFTRCTHFVAKDRFLFCFVILWLSSIHRTPVLWKIWRHKIPLPAAARPWLEREK